jgi:hypothetical protein
MVGCWGRGVARGVRLGVALMLALAGGAEAQRLALVAGVGAYEHLPPVPTAAADATAVAGVLAAAGFQVTLLTDAHDKALRDGIATLTAAAPGAEAIVLFYAGHAVQIAGENRLVPVDARLDDPATLEAQTVALSDIIPGLSPEGVPLVLLLDAARPSPVAPQARRLGVGAGGLAPLDAPRGGAVVMSAAPGAMSFDRGGAVTGAFATALVAHLDSPGLGFAEVMLRVTGDVEVATVGRQVPWVQSALRAPFLFMPDAAAPAAAGFEIVAPGITLGPAPTPEAPPAPEPTAAPSGTEPPVPEDLPRAVQAELRRLGCYRQAVDGDWGPGSRRALARYHEVKKTPPPDPAEPTEAVWRGLLAEPDGLCPAPPPPTPRTSAAPRQQQPQAPSKPATTERREPKCTFVGIAIICR